MKIILEHLNDINKFNNKDLFLPNSVFIYNKSLVICDGGNNRVCIIEKEIDKSFQIGDTYGISKNNFKEPVYAMKQNDKVFVCDWHNHRVVIYKNKFYDDEIGFFWTKKFNFLKNIKYFLRNLISLGSFSLSHFPEVKSNIKKNRLSQLKLLNESIFYYVRNIKIFFRNIHINKPNGCIIENEKLYFTQKNNKSVTVVDLNNKEIDFQIENSKFGRLGQISIFQGNLYICDETNNILWIYDSTNYKLIENKSITTYKIFSISLNEKYIAVCGETSFSLFDHNFTLLYEKLGHGEYHGVSLNNDILYVCNRLKNKIEKYKIIKDEK